MNRSWPNCCRVYDDVRRLHVVPMTRGALPLAAEHGAGYMLFVDCRLLVSSSAHNHRIGLQVNRISHSRCVRPEWCSYKDAAERSA